MGGEKNSDPRATSADIALEPMVDEEPTSAWSPLRYSVFRALWIASLVSNIGTWMQNVGGVWLMSSLSPSPFLVALMQTATSLPVFLVGIPAGALADLVDRRRLLLCTQGLMLIASAVLSAVTIAGAIDAWGPRSTRRPGKL